MKYMTFASRNRKEMLRDPLNLAFGIGFPIIIMLLLTAIQSNVPEGVELFNLDKLTPGIAVFGLSFVSLFSATLISKDRTTSFLMRLFASPLKSSDFILGYILPLLPMAIVQNAVCFALALVLGMSWTINILLVIIVLLPCSILFIGFGLLTGSIFNDKQVGGICGALLTNLTAWLSGTWFDLNLVGGAFKTVADIFPFVHAVNAARCALSGDFSGIFPDLWWVIGYAVVTMAAAIMVFKKKMNNDNI